MKKNIKQIVAVALILVMLVTFVPLHADAVITQNASLKLLTDSYTDGNGSFKLTTTARLFVVSAAAPSAQLQQTAELINAEFAAEGLPSATPLPLVWGDKQLVCEGDIILELVDGLAAEEYLLKVTKDNITVSAADTDGLLYGAHMAIKHFQVYNGMEIPACTVQDKPDTIERTFMLDCARKYYSVEWICNLIREMSWMGYNTLELHLTEDGGVRGDIWDEAYFTSKNGNDYSWLCGGESAWWVYTSSNWSGQYAEPNKDKNLTAVDLIKIFDTAKAYHIDVIPSINSPSHCEYLATKYYQYIKSNPNYTFTYAGKTYSKNGVTENGVTTAYADAFPNAPRANFSRINFSDCNPGESCTHYSGSYGYSCNNGLDVSNPVAVAFMYSVLEDYADFFRRYAGSTKFNIGCDETDFEYYADSDWATYAEKNDFGSTAYDAFANYLNNTAAMLQEKNYTVRAFSDELHPNSGTVKLDTSIEVVFWTTKSGTDAATAFLNKGYNIYNAIESFNYYVLRLASTATSYPGMDALDPNNGQWAFTYGTAENNYNLWNPTHMYSKGASSPTVPDAQLGQLKGAYYFLWSDFAGLKTEEQIWNGIDADGTYNIRERMWSNITKMWNWDVNSGLTFDKFSSLRSLFGDYPGFTAPSSAPSIPAASVMHRAADFTALQEQIAKEPSLSASEYTAESYAAYTAALAAATQAEVDAARDNLAAAFGALQLAIARIVLKTTVGEEVKILAETEVEGGDIALELQGRRGYRFLRVEGNATYTPLFSGADGGTIQGTVSKDMPIVIWYENVPQLDTLARLLSVDDAALLTANSGYAAEKQSAISFYNSVKDAPEAKTTQDIIDGYVNSLIAARTLATADAAETKIISLKTTTETVAQGKNAVLLVTTSPDVASVSIENVTLTDYEGKLTVTDSGDKVKIWYLSFVMETAREEAYSYTVTASGKTTVTDTFSIFCQ